MAEQNVEQPAEKFKMTRGQEVAQLLINADSSTVTFRDDMSGPFSVVAYSTTSGEKFRDRLVTWLARIIDSERVDAVKKHDKSVRDQWADGWARISHAENADLRRNSVDEKFRQDTAKEIYLRAMGTGFIAGTIQDQMQQSVEGADALISALAKMTPDQVKDREAFDARQRERVAELIREGASRETPYRQGKVSGVDGVIRARNKRC